MDTYYVIGTVLGSRYRCHGNQASMVPISSRSFYSYECI